ncbi:hypothetical protein KIMH_02370 [Bombiscardovia apis]|uniref:DUF805 domain-containing protein n=1 Tax=Bombiscardovia apis TaxID=2932182 RepID=A0ABN6SGT8_9BIFI|nr:hypothetical protein KIMH_02370 [Bombiscardovia apis]
MQSYGQPQYGQQAQPQQPQFTQQGQFMGGQPSVPQVPPTYSGELGANGQPAFNQPWYGISFGAAVKRFFTKYVDFTGRASKGEFWWPVLMIALVDIILNIITSPMGTVGDYIGYVWRLAIVLPMLAVTTRRIHDSNTAGWWTILPAVLTYGGLGIMYSTINSLDPDILMYQDTSAIDESTLMTIGWGVIAACAGLIIWLVFGVRQSNPLGTRFDKQSQDQGQNPNPMQ